MSSVPSVAHSEEFEQLRLSYEDVVADGTWSSDFYQSPQSKDYSNPYFENGELHVDPYMVEQGQ